MRPNAFGLQPLLSIDLVKGISLQLDFKRTKPKRLWCAASSRWVFLPSLVCTVPLLVMVEGGDALQICLNTVAILFLCDIGETPPPVC